MKKILLLLIGIAGFILPAAEPPQIDVLLLGYYISMPDNYRAELVKQGINVFQNPNDKLSGDPAQYPMDYLKKFNVVVAAGPIGYHWSPRVLNEVPKGMADRLLEYQKAGGAVIWIPYGLDEAVANWNEGIGSKIGVEAVNAHFRDPANTKAIYRPGGGSTAGLSTHIHTTRIGSHAVTKDVKNLFLNIRGEWGCPGIIPLKTSSDWQVLVRPEKSAYLDPDDKKNTKESLKEKYPDPGIIAVYSRQGGRMAILPLYPAGTWENFNHIAVGSPFLRDGDGKVKADGEKLLVNMFRWLGEDSLKHGFGGFHNEPKAQVKPSRPLDLSIVTYPAKVSGNASLGKDWHGLIGAQSVNGGGSGTVQEWAAAAKKAGLNYLVFIDDVKKYDPQTYEVFRQECLKASSPECLILPGFGGMDANGLFRYYVNPNKFPAKDSGFLNEKGEIVLQHKLVALNGWQVVGGMAYLSKAPYSTWYPWIVSTAAVLVYEDGKIVNDSIREWVINNECNNSNQGPTSLVRMKSPAELESMAKEVHQTIVFGKDVKKAIQHAMKSGCGERMNVYISNGPRIQFWGPAGGHWLNPTRPDSDRYVFGLRASSDVGLKEIEIREWYSGKIIRKISLNGEKEYRNILFNISNNRQYVMTLKLTDVNGHTAIAPWYNWQPMNRVWFMGDRLMGMQHFSELTEDNKLVGGGGAVSIPYNKTFSLSAGMPNSPMPESQLKFRGYDGGYVYTVGMHLECNIVAQGMKPEHVAAHYKLRQASHDTQIWDKEATERRPDGVKFNFNGIVPKLIPTELADITIRNYGTRQGYRKDFYAVDYEYTIRFKRDAEVRSINLTYGHGGGDEGEYDHWYLRTGKDGEVKSKIYPFAEKSSVINQLAPGGYMYQGPYLGGAAGFIVRDCPDPVTISSVHTPGGNGKKFGMRNAASIQFKNRKFAKGDVYRFSIILVNHKFNEAQSSNVWLEKFVKDFAIGGGKPGFPFRLKQGKFSSMNYFLDLEAENGGVAASFPKYDMGQRIPIRISGLKAETSICGEFNLKTGRLRVLPIFEGKHMISTIDPTAGDLEYYFGTLITWNDPALVVTMVPNRMTQHIEVHNPTGEIRKYEIKGCPGFEPLADFKASGELKPYETAVFEAASKNGSIKPVIFR